MDCHNTRCTGEVAPGRARFYVTIIAFVVACTSSTAVGAEPEGAPGTYAVELGALVNDYRKQQGLTPLVPDARLERLANAHSADMASARKMSHHGFEARLQKTGYKRCVENVGWNYPGAPQQLEGWKNSPGHDHNLRDARVTRMGIGMATGYVTLIACG